MDDSSKRDLESLQRPPQLASTADPLTPVVVKFPWLPGVAFSFLTLNLIHAVYRARGDPWTVFFVISTYLELVLLFWCLRRLETPPRDGTRAQEQKRLKLTLWILAMILSAMLSYPVATINISGISHAQEIDQFVANGLIGPFRVSFKRLIRGSSLRKFH